MPAHYLEWRRRIFASVDVAGSTAFKQRSPEDSGRWANIFKLFFDEFPTTLRACFDKLPILADGKPSHAMSVWKFVGDEILFSATLDRHEAVVFHVVAFREAINEYTAQLKRKPELASLSLKGTMWGAGFPVTNVEVNTKLGQGNESDICDYIGPCVDQGFRLCSLADSRKIPLSVDLVYLMANTKLYDNAKIMLRCDEPQSHKGVPLKYPHIWLDRRNEGETEEDRILGRRKSFRPSELVQYIDELYSEKRPGLFKPFIVTDAVDFFKKVPPEIEETRKRLLQESADQSYTASSVAGTPKPSEAPPTPTLPNSPR